jgi:uncharacterized protein (DUF433 family)
MIGKPLMRATRITVELIIDKFAADYSEDEADRPIHLDSKQRLEP